MSATKYQNASRARAMGPAVFALVISFIGLVGPHCHAQTQAQTDTTVKEELQIMKARLGQLESTVNYLAAAVTPSMSADGRHERYSSAVIALTGKVSCGSCGALQPAHKGYTQFSWALQSVNQGDDIVLVAANRTYKLHGDKDKLLKFMCDKARITGRLQQASDLVVETIDRPSKNE